MIYGGIKMNELQIFKNPDFGQVRVVNIYG